MPNEGGHSGGQVVAQDSCFLRGVGVAPQELSVLARSPLTFALPVVVGEGYCRLEVHDAYIRRHALKNGQEVAPHVRGVHPARDRIVPFREMHVPDGGSHVALVQLGMAGARSNLVDASPEHHVA